MAKNRWYYRGGIHLWNPQNPNFRARPYSSTTISSKNTRIAYSTRKAYEGYLKKWIESSGKNSPLSPRI